MLRWLKWTCALLFIAGLAAAWIVYDYREFVHAPLNLGAPERVIQVAPGSSARAVAKSLVKDGIIDSEWMMLYLFRKSGLADKLQPGPVVLTPEMTPSDLPTVLARVGKYERRSVQILPGMNVYEIAERLQTQRLADKKQFLNMVLDPVRSAQAGIPGKSFEGYLASGAYTFEPGTSAEDIVQAMHHRWMENWRKIVAENRGAYEAAIRRKMSDHNLVTLASMVEKEAVVDKERPVIARVFWNRLRKKMKLQSDPTCVYPPKIIGEKPHPSRCKDPENTYSTYVIEALPPGPIAVPSSASLKAVLKPYEGPDATSLLYFVARQDGSWTHYFSKTYKEHQNAVNYFLKGQKNNKPKGTVQPKY